MTTAAGRSSPYGANAWPSRARRRRGAGVAAGSTVTAPRSAIPSAYEDALRICVICASAAFVALATLAWPLTIFESMLWSTFAFSTFAQFFAAGTNQLYSAALANGPSVGLPALIFTRDVVLGMFPASAILVSADVDVKSLIQSIASCLFFVVTGTARSEPPRNVGMYLPGVWLGIGNAPTWPASAGLPTFASSA